MDRDEQAVQGDRSDGDAFSAEGRRTADSTEGAMGEAPLSQGPDDGVERPAPQPCIRMIIEQLDMHNFKSYAGMRTIGPFHKRFSSIVGPNGSGKSNVIDALLFVFGKRASQIRLKKVSELIHNSEHHRNLDSATVSVHFADIVDDPNSRDDYTIVEGSRLVISRTAFRNNSSKYSVNGQPSTFTDVTKLLMAKGIDLDHNRFLILQGEVEQIAMMKPKGGAPGDSGILEYLEDIIGSHKYVEQIEQATANVELCNQERQSKANRLKMSESERTGLQSARDEAVAYLREEYEMLCMKAKLYLVYTNHAKDNVETVKANMEVLEKKLADEVASHEQMEKDFKECSVRLEAAQAECEAFEAELSECASKFEHLDRRDVQLREAAKHTMSKLKKLKAKLKQEQNAISKCQQDIETFNDELPELSKLVDEKQAELADAEAVRKDLFEQVRSKTGQLREQLEAKQKLLIPLRQEVNHAEQHVAGLESELQFHASKCEDAKAAVADAHASVADTTKQLSEKRDAIKTLAKSIGINSTRERSVLEAIAETDEAIVKLETSLNQMRAEYEQGRAKLEQHRNRGSVLTALMEAKARGHLPGIFGRLGDLGSIDSRYDVAVSTACPALDNIVVDTVETAQRSADLLRKTRAGSTTFIILEKIQHVDEQMSRPFQSPENVPRLFDLVNPIESIFRPAFYFALRDTVVANDLDQATRISSSGSRRFRVVTYSGELVDPSGTMTGGGRASRGAMGSGVAVNGDMPVSAERLEELSSAIARTSVEMKELHQKRRTLRLEHDALQDELRTVRSQKDHAEAARNGLEQLLTDIRSRLADLDHATEQAATESALAEKSLRPQIQSGDKTVNAARKKASSLEAEVAGLEQKILDAGGLQLQEQVKIVQALKDEIESTRRKITHAEVNIDGAHKRIAAAEKSIVTTETNITKTEQELEESAKQLNEIEELAAQVIACREEISATTEKKRGEFQQVEAQHKRISKAFEAARATEVEVKMQIDDCQRLQESNLAKAAHWQKKLDEVMTLIRQSEGAKHFAVPAESQPGEESHTDDMEVEDHAEARQASMTFKLPDAVGSLDKDGLEHRLKDQEEKLSSMKPNMSSIEEYAIADGNYKAHLVELEAATATRDDARAHCDALRNARFDDFMAGFRVITMKLKEMYQMLTLGCRGDAELELVDSLDPFSEGIVFSVRPPKKSWKNISNLSGGEKTLSSLALVFALHYYKPTPLYVMDEIDAALDFKNVSIVANYIKDRTRDAQFIIISLRSNMFELADRLVGIYKTDNCSKSITINPKKFADVGVAV
ncbi:hypothetical protein PBRA_004202 [Plasmodiophora brassicae]|uniref:Structural maintenance of chromosomes protein n=1 Tax=Plasmodiophora brassicae TaxID=37360 RepID=A0A0G4IJR2_PLABS|nr:hypothetical protein PBRA_004202 [Plasmodiophora brassicae]